jgi:hypothetical protein
VPPDPGPARRRPPGRYDEPSRTASRAVAALLTVLLLGFLTAIAWVLFQRYTSDEVPFRAVGFTVLGDDAVRVELEVTPEPGTTAWCLLRSRGGDGLEVGRVFVPVAGRPDGRTVQVEQEYATSAEAVTGEVVRCRPTPPPPGSPTARPSGG